MKCKRCGQCCHYIIDGKIKKCKYLILHSNKLTSCRIYKNRIGTVIDQGIVCIVESPYNFKDCEYNSNIKKYQNPRAD